MRKMHYRAGESDKTVFRSDRFFTVDSEFYFSTREGHNVGPYPNHTAGERRLDLYIHTVNTEKESSLYAAKIGMQGLWGSTMYH